MFLKMVPTGTSRTVWSAFLPWQSRLFPLTPFGALTTEGISFREVTSLLAWKKTKSVNKNGS